VGAPELSRRYVFDTNVVVSALLFEGGRLAWLRAAWAAGELTPVVSGATVTELVRVLAYPKFGLAPADREELLGDLLPYAEVFDGDPASAPIEAPDAADQPFVDLVLACGATALVTGDAALLALAPRVPVIRPGDLRSRERRSGEEPRAG